MAWYMEEYGRAQVSMNLTDLSVTPIHTAFEEVKRVADSLGIGVTGSELIGLVPLPALLEAGRYFHQRSTERSSVLAGEDLISLAVKSLGLSDLTSFHPEERIIEYCLKNHLTD